MRVAVLLLLATVASAETEAFECDSTAGFSLTNCTDTPPAGATLVAEKGALLLRHDRAALAAVLVQTPLVDLARIAVTVESKSDAPFVLLLVDRDGARWVKAVPIAAGKRTEVAATPADFALTDDSPVKKPRLDPARLGFGALLFDGGFLGGAKGEGELRIDRVVVERTDPKRHEGEWVIDSAVTVEESTLCTGNIRVKKGGSLRVTAPRFVLQGNLAVEGGSVEAAGGAWIQAERFNHERRIDLAPGTRLRLADVLIITLFPLALSVADGAEYVVERTQQIGGISATLGETSRVTCAGGAGLNEFVIPPGARCEFRDCAFLVLWFTLGPNLKGDFSFPSGDSVDSWAAGAGHAVTITRSRNVHFCLLSSPGSAGRVTGSEVFGAGILLAGDEPVTLTGLTNKAPMDDVKLAVSDRDLRFVKTTVGSWTIYPALHAQVRIEKCLFGESLAFGDAREEIVDSICDGTGGYLGAQERSRIHAVRTRITCLVVARDAAEIVLEDCEIAGEVRATGHAKVRLVRCKVDGQVVCDPGATLVREP